MEQEMDHTHPHSEENSEKNKFNPLLIGLAFLLVLAVIVGPKLLGSKTDSTSVTETESIPNVPVIESGVMEPITNGPVKEFTVEGANFKFSPNKISVKKGDSVKVTFKNLEGTHDFVIDELSVRTKTLQAGGEEVVIFTADKTGSFEFYCSIGSHRKMGMVGTLTVD